MTTVIKTNPDLPSGDTWNTTTYTPAATVPKFGGNTNQFNVVDGAVILNGGVSISGDTGIIFPTYTLNEVDPLFEIGDNVITFDATEHSTVSTDQSSPTNVLVEVITINNTPPSVANNSLRVTLEVRRNDVSGGSGGAVVFHKDYTGAEKAKNVVSASSTSYVLNTFGYNNVDPQDYIQVYINARGYTVTGPKGETQVSVTTYVKNTSSNALSNAWQSTYPGGITRSNS